VLCKLLDRVAAVTQDAGVAVDVCDCRGGCCGVHEAGVIGDSARLLQQLGNVVSFVSFYNLDPRELELAAGMAQGSAGGLSHGVPFMRLLASVESLIQPTSGDAVPDPAGAGTIGRTAFMEKATIDSQLKATASKRDKLIHRLRLLTE